ncbi:hypothetical protein SS50377_27925 [Spironucleus salmonicida]|uniref:Uncharacterized protein n=1 Tax=Spironucleus salmonicida TaxID=348837 RepID=V6LDC7_9EUKA|nr:hypothetical protein SS50377_27925 [Spironucleus salmonicida]|eukprot:EST42487.1 Hypothetical protein SS50377_17793 [Spironucleus salmonicida]
MQTIFDYLYALKKNNKHLLDYMNAIGQLNKSYSANLTSIQKKYEKFPYQSDIDLKQYTNCMVKPTLDYAYNLLAAKEQMEKQRRQSSEVVRLIQTNYQKLLKKTDTTSKYQTNPILNQFYISYKCQLQTCSDNQNLLLKQILADLERTKNEFTINIQKQSLTFYQQQKIQSNPPVIQSQVDEFLPDRLSTAQVNSFQDKQQNFQLLQTSGSDSISILQHEGSIDNSKMDYYLTRNPSQLQKQVINNIIEVEFGSAPIL